MVPRLRGVLARTKPCLDTLTRHRTPCTRRLAPRVKTTFCFIAALDHAKIAEGPGGPAEMVPGQHHVRINIAQAKHGRFEIVER